LAKDDDVNVYPQPTEDPTHAPPGCLLPDALADDRPTLHEEKERDARVPLAAHGKDGAFVEKARGKERAEHEANVTPDLAAGYTAKNEESLAEQLVPALRPELMQRLRSPWVIHDWWPGARRVGKEPDGEQGDQVINHSESGNKGDTSENVDGGRDDISGGKR